MKFASYLSFVSFLLVAGCADQKYIRGNQLAETKGILPAAKLDSRLVLIGDTGKADYHDAIMTALREVSGSVPDKTTVVFLGDNIYERGLPAKTEDDYGLSEKRLKAQLDTMKTSRADSVFIPGNHDWDHGNPDGRSHLINQQNYIAGYNKTEQTAIKFYPQNGCPDIITQDVGRYIRLVFIDSQVLIYLLAGKKLELNGCKVQTPADFRKQFTEIIKQSKTAGREVILNAHHPMVTEGAHGGYFGLKHHLIAGYPKNKYVPFPIVASMIVWGRQAGWVTSTDASHPTYNAMIIFLQSLLKKDPIFVSAAGHDHNLQFFDGNSFARYYLVSGSGSKTDAVGNNDQTRYALNGLGFMVLDTDTAGNHFLAMVEVDETGHKITFSSRLKPNP